MTRIIAGKAGGRTLRVPRRGTRPTPDRVREATFSLLEARLGGFEDLAVLDLFAGSGALGLEAISRGATRAVLVDNDRLAEAACRANAAQVTADSAATVTVLRTKVGVMVTRPWPGQPFDLVFLDPPYVVGNSELSLLLANLGSGSLLAEGATVVVERPSRLAAPTWPDGWTQADQRAYGDTTIYVAVAG